MATVMPASNTQQIGETAGMIWRVLEDSGPLSTSKLVKLVEAPRDAIMQGIGWLAREDKLEIEDTSRGRVISLRSL